MRNISFALTTRQFKERSKTVTRRLGWRFLKPGTRLMGCEKCQGLKPGEKLVKLGEIEVVSVRKEPLSAIEFLPDYGKHECALEGFPNMDGIDFVLMFCSHMKAFPSQTVTRIEFKYVEDESC